MEVLFGGIYFWILKSHVGNTTNNSVLSWKLGRELQQKILMGSSKMRNYFSSLKVLGSLKWWKLLLYTSQANVVVHIAVIMRELKKLPVFGFLNSTCSLCWITRSSGEGSSFPLGALTIFPPQPWQQQMFPLRNFTQNKWPGSISGIDWIRDGFCVEDWHLIWLAAEALQWGQWRGSVTVYTHFQIVEVAEIRYLKLGCLAAERMSAEVAEIWYLKLGCLAGRWYGISAEVMEIWYLKLGCLAAERMSAEVAEMWYL